jgi:hypothetical protein
LLNKTDGVLDAVVYRENHWLKKLFIVKLKVNFKYVIFILNFSSNLFRRTTT